MNFRFSAYTHLTKPEWLCDTEYGFGKKSKLSQESVVCDYSIDDYSKWCRDINKL